MVVLTVNGEYYPDGDKSFYYAKVTNFIYENADTESDLLGYVLKFFDGDELNLGFEKVVFLLLVVVGDVFQNFMLVQ